MIYTNDRINNGVVIVIVVKKGVGWLMVGLICLIGNKCGKIIVVCVVSGGVKIRVYWW